MNWRSESIKIAIFFTIFLIFYFLPGQERFLQAVSQGLLLLHDYAKEHVIFCLIPAFFIAGAIEVFVSDHAVLKYLGPNAPRAVAYGVASVAGTVLAVCSCTILPLFAGIYKMGAGLGPATTFLYSGPAINVLAIILSARVLGLDIGLARAFGAILSSLFIGLLMAAIFRRSEETRLSNLATSLDSSKGRPLWQQVAFLSTLVFILIFSTWGHGVGLWEEIFEAKWYLTGLWAIILAAQLRAFYRVNGVYLLGIGILVAIAVSVAPSPEFPYLIGIVGLSLVLYFTGGEARQWLESSYILARQILPILFIGVVIAGFFLGRPGGEEGIVSSRYVSSLVGGNSISSNLYASLIGALMYFATLTEVPILQGLIHSGMGMGPALALLLAGPAVSLPNMLVIRSIMGTRRTLTYVLLVVVCATITGTLFGIIKG